jgi:hypothetical protein
VTVPTEAWRRLVVPKKADCFENHSHLVHVSVTIRMIYCTELKAERILRSNLLWIISREMTLPICKLQQIHFFGLLEPCISLIYAWKTTNASIIIQYISYVWWLLHVLTLYCDPQGAFLEPSERCSIEVQSIKYYRWVCCVWWRGAWWSSRLRCPVCIYTTPRTTPPDTTHPSIIFYRLHLNWASHRRL